jgi:hypothetical protein
VKNLKESMVLDKVLTNELENTTWHPGFITMQPVNINIFGSERFGPMEQVKPQRMLRELKETAKGC